MPRSRWPSLPVAGAGQKPACSMQRRPSCWHARQTRAEATAAARREPRASVARALRAPVEAEIAELLTCRGAAGRGPGRPAAGLPVETIESRARAALTIRGDRDAAHALGRALVRGISLPAMLAPGRWRAGRTCAKGVALLLRAADAKLRRRLDADCTACTATIASPWPTTQMARFCLEKSALAGDYRGPAQARRADAARRHHAGRHRSGHHRLHQAAARMMPAVALLHSLVLPLEATAPWRPPPSSACAGTIPGCAWRWRWPLAHQTRSAVRRSGRRPAAWGLVVSHQPFISQIRLSARAIPALDRPRSTRFATYRRLLRHARRRRALRGDLRRRLPAPAARLPGHVAGDFFAQASRDHAGSAAPEGSRAARASRCSRRWPIGQLPRIIVEDRQDH